MPNFAAPGIHLPYDFAQNSSGTITSTFMIGSCKIGPAFWTPSLKAKGGSHFEGHFARVNFMVRAVK
jgi:hypothetical protein